MRPTIAAVSLFLSVLTASASGCVDHGATGPSPVVTTVAPNAAAVGARVTINGSGFAATGNAIQIGTGYLLDVASSDGTTITITIPAALGVCPPGPNRACIALALILTPGQYDLAVVTNAGTSNRVAFVVQER